MLRTLHALTALLLLMTLIPASAQQPATPTASAADPIRYTLRFPTPQTHYVEVEAVYPTAGKPQLDLMMAVWTPGSYLVREYERHVEAVPPKGRAAGSWRWSSRPRTAGASTPAAPRA